MVGALFIQGRKQLELYEAALYCRQLQWAGVADAPVLAARSV